MRVKHQNGKFDLSKMDAVTKGRYGQLLKQPELTNLSAMSAPNAGGSNSHGK